MIEVTDEIVQRFINAYYVVPNNADVGAFIKIRKALVAALGTPYGVKVERRKKPEEGWDFYILANGLAMMDRRTKATTPAPQGAPHKYHRRKDDELFGPPTQYIFHAHRRATDA